MVGVFGLCANIAAIFYLRKKLRHNSTNFHSLMLSLSIFDIAYICMSFLTFCINKFSVVYQEHAWGYIVPWSVPILQISLTGSIYCTMAISLERYFVICRPFYRYSKNWKSSMFILPIIIISITYNITRFCERKTCLETSSIELRSNETIYIQSTKLCGGFIDSQVTSSQQCTMNIPGLNYQPNTTRKSIFVTFTNLKLNKNYQLYSFYSNLILNLLIPYLFLLVLNTLVVLNLRKNDFRYPYSSQMSTESVDNRKGTKRFLT